MIGWLSDIQEDGTRVLRPGAGDRRWDVTDSGEPGVRGPLCSLQRIGDELWFVGSVDASNAEGLAAQATAEVKNGVGCLDLSQVRFFGAAGVRMLFAVHAAALDGGMRVVCSPEVMRTLRVCRVSMVDGLHLTVAPDTGHGGGGAGR